jgi:hypothetical protein
MSVLGMVDCCQDNDECGIMSTIAPDECLPPDAPGGIDPSCPTFDTGSSTWVGCCTPDNECGARSAMPNGDTLGCIANSVLGAPEESCEYDPNNTCTRLFEVTCDGLEDCGAGELCCGHYDGGYQRTACMEVDECAELEETEGGTWSELCHAGDSCADDTLTCLENTTFLPDFLARCPTTGSGDAPTYAPPNEQGEFNCGSAVCESGEKCCISVPGVAVCVDEDEPCSCVPDDGSDAGDAG